MVKYVDGERMCVFSVVVENHVPAEVIVVDFFGEFFDVDVEVVV